MDKPKKNFGEILQSLPKPALFAVLLTAISITLFVTIPVPNTPDKPSQDLYDLVTSIPTDKPVLIASDWTNSTRGESQGHFKALMRILMRRGIKFVIYSTADPQAPQVARDTMRALNDEREAQGDPRYEHWSQWLSAGYFPGAEAQANAIENNFRTAFQDKKAANLEGVDTPIMNSPVLAGVERVSDFSMLVLITASKTSNITIERVKSTQLALMVTGVMGPESRVYYDSGQVKGLGAGLKGVYDIESLMDANPDWKGKTNFDNGKKYYPVLTVALTLLILAVVAGNVGMMLAKKGN